MKTNIPSIYNDLISKNHVLIAGASGSGKSVILNGIIYRLLYKDCRIILIDPKRVDLRPFKKCKQVISYAADINKIISVLSQCIESMEREYKYMERHALRKTDQKHTYIIIDEYADLIIQAKKTVEPKIIRLLQLGRAAGYHVILATQRPTADIVNGAIKCNIDTRIALKVPLAQDSRNIIGVSGAESLPPYGAGVMLDGANISIIDVPMISDLIIQERIKAVKKSIF